MTIITMQKLWIMIIKDFHEDSDEEQTLDRDLIEEIGFPFLRKLFGIVRWDARNNRLFQIGQIS